MRRFELAHVNGVEARSMRSITNHLRQHRYSHESGIGFLVDTVRSDYIEARYCEREKEASVLVDPLGEEIRFERIVYHEVRFKMYSDFPSLLLIDPPRVAQRLWPFLRMTLPWNVSFADCAIDMNDIPSHFERSKFEVTVSRAKLGEIALSPLTSAYAVINGREDVRGYFQRFTHKRSYKLLSMKLQLKSDSGTWELEINQSGKFRISGESEDEIVKVLRSAASR